MGRATLTDIIIKFILKYLKTIIRHKLSKNKIFILRCCKCPKTTLSVKCPEIILRCLVNRADLVSKNVDVMTHIT